MKQNLWFSFATLLGLCTWYCAAMTDQCPLPEDSYPCGCDQEEGGGALHCSYIHRSNQLSNVLKKLTEYQFSSVSLFLYDGTAITSKAFEGPEIKKILFSHSHANLESPPFVGQENSLQEVEFVKCFEDGEFESETKWSMGHLEQLDEMSFRNDIIRHLKNDWLISAPPNLRSLAFERCRIHQLDDKVFAKFTKLTTLNLKQNGIRAISRSMFPTPSDDLQSIDLSNNHIESLQEGVFANMPALTEVRMEGNPIHCDTQLKWVTGQPWAGKITGKCTEPSKLKGKKIQDLVPSDFE